MSNFHADIIILCPNIWTISWGPMTKCTHHPPFCFFHAMSKTTTKMPGPPYYQSLRAELTSTLIIDSSYSWQIAPSQGWEPKTGPCSARQPWRRSSPSTRHRKQARFATNGRDCLELHSYMYPLATLKRIKATFRSTFCSISPILLEDQNKQTSASIQLRKSGSGTFWIICVALSF